MTHDPQLQDTGCGCPRHAFLLNGPLEERPAPSGLRPTRRASGGLPVPLADTQPHGGAEGHEERACGGRSGRRADGWATVFVKEAKQPPDL